jgi:tRNA/rRNA methyltransferase
MKLNLVLVRTEFAGNLGSAARALANMGGDRLILIAPHADYRCEGARQMAAGAQAYLQNATIYPSWSEFYAEEGEGLRVALTRRSGRNRKVFALDEKLSELKSAPVENLYLILGPEADGLDVDDLAFVNYACHLPVFGEFGSLNLAQAALLALYITRSQFAPAQMPAQLTGEAADVAQPLYFPDRLIKDWLSAMGFDIRARKASAYLTLRRLFLANRPSRHEVQVLEAVLNQNIRKLRKSLGLAPKQLADHVGDIPVE